MVKKRLVASAVSDSFELHSKLCFPSQFCEYNILSYTEFICPVRPIWVLILSARQPFVLGSNSFELHSKYKMFPGLIFQVILLYTKFISV